MLVLGLLLAAGAVTGVIDPTVGIGIGAAATIAMLIGTIFKPLIETKIKSDAPLHDPIIRSLAIVMGIVWYEGTYLSHAATVSGTGVIDQILPGIVVGGGSVITYHLVNGSAPGAKTPPNKDGVPGSAPGTVMKWQNTPPPIEQGG